MKYTDYSFCLMLIQILFLSISRRGMRDVVKVVLWYIYSCQSVTSWDADKINSWDFASLPLAVSRSTYFSHASHPILFDISQVNTNCQSALKSDSHIYRKVVLFSLGSKGQQTPVNSCSKNPALLVCMFLRHSFNRHCCYLVELVFICSTD